MPITTSVERNITLLFALKAAKWFMLFMPVIVLFFMDNGLSVEQVMWTQTAYSLSVALFEMPSGYFSDKLGRRLTLILGMLITIMGYLVMSASYSFWWFVGAEILMGLGGSFISGTDSAMLYDTLLQLKRENTYLKLEGRMYSIATFSEAVAAIFGGWIAATFGMRMTVYAFIGCLVVGLVCAFRLIEPQVEKNQTTDNNTSIRDILRFTFLQNKMLRWYIILSASIGTSTLTMAWFAQPYMQGAGLSLTTIGWLWSALNLTVAVFAFGAYYVYRFLNKRQIVILIVAGIVIGFGGLGWSYGTWGLIFIFLIYVVRGIATPVLKDFVNELTPSNMRATVLSIRGFVIRIIFSSLAPFLGWISDVYTLQQAFSLAALVFGILGSVSLLALIISSKTPPMPDAK